MVRRQNEGSFGCEAVARALGQPNVPECAVGFHFLCPYAAKILFSFCRLFCLFTMNANLPAFYSSFSTKLKQNATNNNFRIKILLDGQGK